MTPVKQTIFTTPGGDCFRACVASILELPIEDVPHFLEDGRTGENWTEAQWNRVRKFATERELVAGWLSVDTDHDLVPKLEASGGYYVATGVPKGTKTAHCVVMRKGAVEHDPYPGNLREFENGPFLWVYFLRRNGSVIA